MQRAGRECAAESDHRTDTTQSSHPPARQPAARAVTQSARATHHHQRRCACGRAQLSKGMVCCDAPFCGNTGSTSFGQCTCVWQLPNAPERPKMECLSRANVRFSRLAQAKQHKTDQKSSVHALFSAPSPRPVGLGAHLLPFFGFSNAKPSRAGRGRGTATRVFALPSLDRTRAVRVAVRF